MKRILMPREHGTYAQLVFPLLSGLLVGGLDAPAAALALAATALFLSYEPVALLLGVRGVRLQREHASRARVQLSLLVPLALALGTLGLALAPASARLLALAPLALSALLLPLVRTRNVKSILGETLAAAALSSMHLTLAAAGRATGTLLWAPAFVWFAGFFAATLAVHAIKARQKDRTPWLVGLAVAMPLLGVGTALAIAVSHPPLRLIASALAVPMLAVLAVHVARVHPRELRRVGWTLVAANAATLFLLALIRT